MPLPNFIIIGAMKSGTSTIHSNLQLHPEIGMSRLKETHYFDRFYERPIEWYSNQFNSGKEINGESTPAYSWNHVHPEVPARIFKNLPEAKIIYVLRDPIDRITSHLHHDLYRGRFKLKDVDKVVLEDPQYLHVSKYYYQLRNYLKYYEKDKILLVQTESIKEDANLTLNKIAKFLGAESFIFSPGIKARNQSSRKYLIRNYDIAHKYLPRPLARFYHLLFYVVNEKIPRPVLKPETVVELKNRLSADIEQLKTFSGEEFTNWKTYNKITLGI